MLKEVACFVVGGVVSSLITYAIVNDKYREMYKNDYAELQAERAALRAEGEPDRNDAPEVERIDIPQKPLPYGGESIIPTENPYIHEQSEGVTDYGKYSKEAEEADIDEANESPSEELREEPYVISEKEYAETRLWYDKDELNYYGRDRILTDSEDNPLEPEVRDLIGEIAFSELERTSSTVHIRNDRIAADYMISYLDQHFNE